MRKTDFLIIGCGFAGATFANLAAERGYTVHLVDKRNHIGGNCYTYKDEISQVEVHKYGPHIFHTNSTKVWEYVNRFAAFNNYINRVKARTNNQVFGMPINLHTINQFFGKAFTPEAAKKHIDSIRLKDKEFLVCDIPSPKLYLGGVSSGEEVSLENVILDAQLSPSFPAEIDIKIKDWELLVGSKKTNGRAKRK